MMNSAYIVLALFFVIGGSNADMVKRQIKSGTVGYDRGEALDAVPFENIHSKIEDDAQSDDEDSQVEFEDRYSPQQNSATYVTRKSTKEAVIPRCKVSNTYPYDISPEIEVTGVTGLFNAVLLGYQSPHSKVRENKGSMFGWTTILDGGNDEEGVTSFTFNANYVPIKVAAKATSYCAVIMQPPLSVNAQTLRSFSAPARHRKRFLYSMEAFKKLLKVKKIDVLTSCCFVVYT